MSLGTSLACAGSQVCFEMFKRYTTIHVKCQITWLLRYHLVTTGHLRCTDGWYHLASQVPAKQSAGTQAVRLVPGNAAAPPVRSRYWQHCAVGLEVVVHRPRVSCALSRIAVKMSLLSLCFISGLRVCLFFSLSYVISYLDVFILSVFYV